MSEKRLAVLSIIVEDRSKSPQINTLLSEYGDSVLSVVIDAPMEIINTLTGKIGMLGGVAAKTLTSKV